MVQYEYKVLENIRLDQQRFNELGAEGWEIISITATLSANGDFMYYDVVFKRRLQL